MNPLLGHHYVKTTYGTWLPGDPRGHWSSVIHEETGQFVEHRRLHDGDHSRLEAARAEMKHSPVRLDGPTIKTIEACLEECQRKSDWIIAAAAIEPSHLHLLIRTAKPSFDSTAKWLAQQMTRAIHRQTNKNGPVWTEGYWATAIDNEGHWSNAIDYIEQHNIRRGLGPRPYSFLRD